MSDAAIDGQTGKATPPEPTAGASARLSLRRLLVVLVTVAVLPGFIVVLMASAAERREQVDRARADLEATTRLVVANQEQLVDGVRHSLTALAAAPAVRRADLLPMCVEMMSALQGKYPEFAIFGLLDMTGHMVCQPAASQASLYAGDRRYYQRALETQDFAVGEFAVGRVTGKQSIGFGLPVQDGLGSNRGVVFASLDLAYANQRFKTMQLPAGIRVNISDAQGVLLVSSLDEPGRVGRPVPEAALRDAILARRFGGFDATDAQGVAWLHQVQAIGGFGQGGVVVAVSTRRADALAASAGRLRLQLATLVAATLLGLYGAWAFGNIAVARPARQLLARMQRLERGDTDGAAPAASRTEEFAALGEGLSIMQRRLAAREAERTDLLDSLQRQYERMLDAQRMGRIAHWVSDIVRRERTWSAHADIVLGFDPPTGAHAFSQYLAHVHPDDVAAIREGNTRLLAGHPTEFNHRVIRADGSIGWIHAIGQREVANDGTLVRVFGLVQDVTERKRAEAALRDNERRLTAAMDAARLGIFDNELATGRLTWLGHHEALWGYAPGEFDGRPAMFEQRIHPQDLPAVRRALATATRLGGSFAHEYRVVWPDGSVHWIADQGEHVPAHDGQPARVSGVAMDTTERKLAQQRIDQANRRILSLLETMTDGFVTLDRQWRVIDVNPRACTLIGHPADWLLTRRYFDLYPADTPFVHAYRRTLEDRVATHVEARDPASGRWIEAHAYPSDEGVSIFFRDITRRKNSEADTQAMVQRLQALREMDGGLLEARAFEEIGAIGANRLRALTGSWGSSVSLIDQAAGVINLLSLDAPEVRPAPSGLRPLAEWYAAHELLLLNRGEVCHVPDVAEAADLPVGVRAVVDLGACAYLRVPMRVEGVLIGVVSLAKDVAEPFSNAQIEVSLAVADRIAVAFEQARLRGQILQHTQQLERRVAERTAEVEAANKELEAFSYSVSHDLRAPLQAIEGFSRALAERHATQIDARGRHYLDRIRAGTQQMATLIDDLISLARVSRADLRLDRIDLAEMARGIVERLRAAAPEREVRVDIQTPLLTRGDSRLLGMLMVNLLDNAWKFSSRTAAPHIEVGAAVDAAGQTEYFVADNGAGFDMRYADKLFGAFQRLHSASEFPGSGIGLATVERIAVRHGGAVRAESVPGVRTVVWFRLGLVASSSAPPTKR